MGNSDSIEVKQGQDQIPISWNNLSASPSSEEGSMIDRIFWNIGQMVEWIGDHFFVLYLVFFVITMASILLFSNHIDQSITSKKLEQSTHSTRRIKNPRRLRRYLSSQTRK